MSTTTPKHVEEAVGNQIDLGSHVPESVEHAAQFDGAGWYFYNASGRDRHGRYTETVAPFYATSRMLATDRAAEDSTADRMQLYGFRRLRHAEEFQDPNLWVSRKLVEDRVRRSEDFVQGLLDEDALQRLVLDKTPSQWRRR